MNSNNKTAAFMTYLRQTGSSLDFPARNVMQGSKLYFKKSSNQNFNKT